MAELQRPNTVAIGSIGNLVSVAPRMPTRTGLEKDSGELQGARYNAQADLVDGQGGEQISRYGEALSAQGQEFLKPLAQLAQAREVLQAGDIAVQASLDMRGYVQALRSSGKGHMEWVGSSLTEFDKINKDAITRARNLSPAAEEVVTRELQQERLRLLGSVQQAVLGAETDNQIANLNRLDTYSRETFFQLGTPEERAGLAAKLVTGYRVAAQTGLVKPEWAEQKIQEFQVYVAQNGAEHLAQEQGLPAAMEFVNNSTVLGPVEKQQAIDRAIHVVGTQQRIDDIGQKAKEKELRLAQDRYAYDLHVIVSDPKTSISDLNAVVTALGPAVTKREVRDEDAKSILKVARDAIDNRTKPVPQKDDPQAVAEWTYKIAYEPQSVEPNAVMSDSRIPESRSTLIKELRASQDKAHFRNQATFKNLVAQINAVEPPTAIWDLNKDNRSLRSEVESAIGQLDRAMSQAAGPGGILKDADILRIGQPLAELAIKQLREKKTPNIGVSFDTLQGMK